MNTSTAIQPATNAGQLTGKVIIVTGAASGIGRATSLRLAEAGATVVLSDITADAGEAAAGEIAGRGLKSAFIRADLSREEDIAALVDGTVRRFGKLDGAFNNAGISQVNKSLLDLTTEDWETAMRVDLTSVFWCLKYELSAMKKTGGGAVVNTASSLGQVAIRNAAEYIAAKHGVIGITRAAAAEYADHGVRVNAVLPGIIETPMVVAIAQNPDFRAFLDKLKDRHPIGRFGKPHEIGDAVVWLLSDTATFMNGATIAADGGYLAI